jgi:hypothetical protein
VVIDFTDVPPGNVETAYQQPHGLVFSSNAVARPTSADPARAIPVLDYDENIAHRTYFSVQDGFTDYLSFAMYNTASRSIAFLLFLRNEASLNAGFNIASMYVDAPPNTWTQWNLTFSGVAKGVNLFGIEVSTYAQFTNITYVPVPKAECPGTSYWIWNPTTNTAVGELTNNTELCLPQPYNIEARPCSPPAKLPVTVALKNATLANLQSRNERDVPYLLWGDDPATGDVFPNKVRLADGTYWVESKIDGVVERIRFTKRC